MKHATLLKTIVFVFSIVYATASVAQVARPFKGAWYSDDLYVDIDFYGKTIPDPNSMDEDPCVGIIKIRPEVNSMTYTIENLRIVGKSATATAYFAEKNSKLTFEYLQDGSLKLTSNDGFTYVDDGLVKLPNTTYVLRKAAPFSGTWKLAKGDGQIKMNLYSKEMFEDDYEGNSRQCYGSIYITYNNGMYVDNCLIVNKKTDGNQAVIEYLGGRDGNTYSATLVYNPATKQITVKQPKLVKATNEITECYVTDGLVFVRR